MPVAHQPWLVGLSLIVAIQGAYVGLGLAVQIREAAGARRRLLLAGAALSLGVAVWSMHFVGMLAARLPFPVDYLVLPTLLSFLICVIVVGIGVFTASADTLTPARLAASSCLMGFGIFTMHYLGMDALHQSAHMEHAPLFVASSLAIAIGASGLALWLASNKKTRPPLILSAVAFGLAISGMHYTAMAGLKIFPMNPAAIGAPALSTDLLAIVVAIVAFCVSAVFLLFLIPDRGESASIERPEDWPDGAAFAAAGPGASDVELGRGTFAPLSGAGGPPPRLARHLPVEREGATRFVPVENILAVHANAHYTYIFDGSSKLFCPLAIGVVEARLDRKHFARVHRSHIVNLDRVVGVRRTGEAGLAEFDAPERYSVPVARNKVNWLKSRIEAMNSVTSDNRST
jgi:NO-binding membrane sensor protein with MHYT domain